MENNPRNVIPFDRPAAYWRRKAEHSKSMSHYAAAAQYFAHALKKSGNADIRRGLADTYAAMGSFTASNRLYLQVLAQDPFDGKSCWGLASNSYLQGQKQMMADALYTYLYVEPYGEYADAAGNILDDTPLGPDAVGKRGMRAYTLLAQCRRHTADAAQAWRFAARAYKLGSNAEACLALSGAAASRKAAAIALEFAKRAFCKSPNNLTCRLAYAQRLDAAGKHGACRALLFLSAPLAINDADAAVFCAAACGTGNALLAVDFTAKRSVHKPQSADCLRLLAACCRHAGQTEQAEVHELAAYRLDGLNDPEYGVCWPGDSTDNPDAGYIEDPERIQGIVNALSGLTRRDAEGKTAREESMKLLEIPAHWLQYLILSGLRAADDIPSLRQALVLPSLLAQPRAMAVRALLELGSPLPYLSWDGNGLSLIRAGHARNRDEDRTALMRTLVKWLNGAVSMERVWSAVPPLWGRLPEAARRHCARGADDVWPLAFSLFLLGSTGVDHKTRRVVNSHPKKKRILRAYRQLLQRMEAGNEMHRL
jgi:tetratricopeptide (TPR) repeat protein